MSMLEYATFLSSCMRRGTRGVFYSSWTAMPAQERHCSACAVPSGAWPGMLASKFCRAAGCNCSALFRRLVQPKNADLFATTLQQLSRSKLSVHNTATYFYIRRPCCDGRSENCNQCNLSLWKYCRSRSLISLRLCRAKLLHYTYEK